jgi:hypothetical protein
MQQREAGARLGSKDGTRGRGPEKVSASCALAIVFARWRSFAVCSTSTLAMLPDRQCLYLFAQEVNLVSTVSTTIGRALMTGEGAVGTSSPVGLEGRCQMTAHPLLGYGAVAGNERIDDRLVRSVTLL